MAASNTKHSAKLLFGDYGYLFYIFAFIGLIIDMIVSINLEILILGVFFSILTV